MSRPEKPINWELVDELLIAGCLGTEIAAHFDMHPDTFYNKVNDKYNMGFTAYCYEKRCLGDSLIRRAQFDKALEKDNSMLIWLGKNRLNQKENHEISVDQETANRYARAMKWLEKMQDERKTPSEEK